MELFGLLVLAAQIYAIVQIVQSNAETTGKVLWTLFVLIVPIIGLLVWVFAGPNGPQNKG